MSDAVERLLVRIDATSEQLRRELKSADKAVEKTDKTIGQKLENVQKHFNRAAVAAAKFGASGVAALSAMTVATVKNAAEIQRFASISQSSTQEFQRFAAGAQKVGIENEKLADIFKDVNDRVGDFVITGGGPLLDFFERIAPKVGVTIDDFRELSGPQALGLYVDSLQKANVSSSEFTFFLEAVASDATALAPLLLNNGKLLKEFGDEAERTGSIMSDDLIKESIKLDEEFNKLQQRTKGLSNNVGFAVIPALNGIVEVFGSTRVEGNKLSQSTTVLSTALIRIAQAGVAAGGVINVFGKGLGGLAAAFAALGRQGDEGFFSTEGLKRASNVLREFRADADATSESYALLLSDLEASLDVNPLEGLDNSAASASERLKDLQDQLRSTAGAGTESAESVEATAEAVREAQKRASQAAKEAADAAKKAADELRQRQEAYISLVDQLQTKEERLTSTLKERLKVIAESSGFSNTGETRSRSIAAAFQGAPQTGGIAPEVGGALGEMLRLSEATQELDAWYNDSTARLAEYRQEKLITQQEFNEQEANLTLEHQDRLLRIEQARQIASLDAAQSIFGSLSDLTAQFAGEQSTAYQVLFAVEKAAAIARSIIAIQTGIAQAAATPWPANLAAMASVASATAGIVSTIASTSIQGQAHDGMMNVPTTGSYILEQGERVTPAETTAKMDKMLDQVLSGSAAPININNYVGEEEFASMMVSRPGERVLNNWLRRNASTVQQLARA